MSLRFTAFCVGIRSMVTLPLCIHVLVDYLPPSKLQETISSLVKHTAYLFWGQLIWNPLAVRSPIGEINNDEKLNWFIFFIWLKLTNQMWQNNSFLSVILCKRYLKQIRGNEYPVTQMHFVAFSDVIGKNDERKIIEMLLFC